MDRKKGEVGRVIEKVREEKRREEKEEEEEEEEEGEEEEEEEEEEERQRVIRKKMQVREKVGKLPNTFFFFNVSGLRRVERRVRIQMVR